MKMEDCMKLKIAIFSIISLPLFASQQNQPTQKIKMPERLIILQILNNNNEEGAFSDQQKNETIAFKLGGQNLYPEAIIMVLYGNTNTERIEQLSEKANRLIEAAQGSQRFLDFKQPDQKSRVLHEKK